MSEEDPERQKQDESLEDKIEDFNLFLEELESDWVDEEDKPVKEPIKAKKPEVKPKSKVVKEKKAIPKPRPVDPSTQEIHVDIETGEVTFDDLDALLEEETEELGQEVLDELIDADVSETIEIDDVEDQVAAPKASIELIDIDGEEDELEEEEEEEIFFGRVERPKNPEQFAHNYLFARFPVNFMLILIPQTIGLLVSIFINKSFLVEAISDPTASQERELDYQNDVIDNYLIAVKLTLVILLAFFLCYRWSTMQNDGSYGYWITQGVNRRKFFIETIYKFLAVIYFGIFAGLLSLFYVNGIYLEFSNFIMLNLLIVSHVLLLISVGIIIGVFTKNPESAALFFIIGFGINYAFNNKASSLLNKVLQSDLQYKADIGDVWLSLVSSIVLGIILILTSLRVHLKLDMEL
ncbi:MAG: hypothetical protein GPJ54_21810 [Candidatus Heimdallarchaeota archaeon]|nr:hypothetical protein [Candidatus Heimdallarchaeota archaeon]